jgi:hypothetical protein
MNRETRQERNIIRKASMKNNQILNDLNIFNESKEINETDYYNYMKTNNLIKYGPLDEKKEIQNLQINYCLNMILKELQILTKRLLDDEIDEEIAIDWKFTAMVIDRLCFLIFLAANLISTALILFTAKNFWRFT